MENHEHVHKHEVQETIQDIVRAMSAKGWRITDQRKKIGGFVRRIARLFVTQGRLRIYAGVVPGSQLRYGIPQPPFVKRNGRIGANLFERRIEISRPLPIAPSSSSDLYAVREDGSL